RFSVIHARPSASMAFHLMAPDRIRSVRATRDSTPHAVELVLVVGPEDLREWIKSGGGADEIERRRQSIMERGRTQIGRPRTFYRNRGGFPVVANGHTPCVRCTL